MAHLAKDYSPPINCLTIFILEYKTNSLIRYVYIYILIQVQYVNVQR